MIWAPYPYRAGFCITDDTDAATLETVRAVYDLLAAIGLRTSKTVWAFEPVQPCGVPPLPPSILRGITLEDPRYLEYCIGLAERGFEICLHGASAGNNVRDRTARALELLERWVGLPGTYICHAKNAENPYWHERVAPRGPAQSLLALASRYRCSGEDPSSPYFWGDLCLEKVRHIRLFRTRHVNTLGANPAMPYFDPEKPWVASWFGATKRSFADATSPEALDRLLRENGVCVLYQYMHRYADPQTGRAQEAFRVAAERLMSASSILVDTTSAIMDRLRLAQGVFLAHRGNQRWVANANDRDVRDLQIRIPAGAQAQTLGPGVERVGDVLHLVNLRAGALAAFTLDGAGRLDAPRAIALDATGHGRARFAFGEVAINAGAAPWTVDSGAPLAAGACRVALAPGMGGPRPLSIAPRSELYGLLGGQLAIIAREVLFRGRSLDSRKFLGSDEIRLEDHSSW